MRGIPARFYDSIEEFLYSGDGGESLKVRNLEMVFDKTGKHKDGPVVKDMKTGETMKLTLTVMEAK